MNVQVKRSGQVASTVTVHGWDGGEFGMCNNLPGDPGPWVNCQQPEHGTVVTCSLCGKVGVMPDEGHVLDFLPDWLQPKEAS